MLRRKKKGNIEHLDVQNLGIDKLSIDEVKVTGQEQSELLKRLQNVETLLTDVQEDLKEHREEFFDQFKRDDLDD